MLRRKAGVLRSAPIEDVKRRLTELRTKYKDVPSIRYPSAVTSEIARLEKRLSAAGITYIGKPRPLRKKRY